MRFLATVAILGGTCLFGKGGTYEFTPTEEQISAHRAEVFRIARDFVVETFNVIVIEEGKFNPVRFNSTGVWGDFQCRIKDLGDSRYEVQGWVLADGYEGSQTRWSVVLRYEIQDPDAWQYRRVDDESTHEPEITSWRYGRYKSVPYEAEYSEDFLTKILH